MLNDKKSFMTLLSIFIGFAVLMISLTVNIIQATALSDIAEVKEKNHEQDEEIHVLDVSQQILSTRLDNIDRGLIEIKDSIKELAK